MDIVSTFLELEIIMHLDPCREKDADITIFLVVYGFPKCREREVQHMRSGDIWIKLIGEDNEGLNIGVCYQPPASDSSVNKILFKNIKQTCQGGETIIMGVFNCPNIKWNLVGKGEEEFLDVTNDLFLIKYRMKNSFVLIQIQNEDGRNYRSHFRMGSELATG